MLGKTHLALGLSTGVIVGSIVFGFSEKTILFASGCSIGALLPDIDHPTSIIGKALKPVNIAVTMFCDHRGIFHTPLLYCLIGLILKLLCPSILASAFCIGLFLGACLHLVQDSFNKQGIMWLYPFKAKITLAKIKSGTPVGLIQETLISTLILLLITVLSVKIFRPDWISYLTEHIVSISEM